MIHCMGGWCQVRDKCAHHVEAPRTTVSERLCEKGNEQPEPLRKSRFAAWIAGATEEKVKQWENKEKL